MKDRTLAPHIKPQYQHPQCFICGRIIIDPNFAFDASLSEDGSMIAHPDCYMYVLIEHHTLAADDVLIHTCGEPMCVNPHHLSARKLQ